MTWRPRRTGWAPRSMTSAGLTASGLSQADVAERMQTSQSAIARLESGQHDAQVSTLARYAAGRPILAEQDIEDVFPLPRQLVGEGTLFLLKVAGDSMINAAITDGDWVVVRQQDDAENGDIGE